MTSGIVIRVVLSVLRLVGGLAFLAPTIGTRMLGVPGDGNGTYLMRLFASRNLALAAGLLLATATARPLWYQVGIGCDALDIVAGLLAWRAGKKRSSAVTDSIIATAFVLLGVLGLLFDKG